MALSATYLTLHRFHDALGELALAERVDPGDPALEYKKPASISKSAGTHGRNAC